MSLLLTVLAAGCGGGEASISKSDFIKRADAMCKRADKTQAGEALGYQKAHSKELSKLSSEALLERLITAVLLPSIQKEAKQIEALGAPSGDEGKVKAIVSGIEEALKEAEKNPASVETSTGSGGPFHEVDKLAREYGFKDCDEIT